MKKLLKDYGFNSDMQYFEIIIESIINGQRQQAKEQFKAMPKNERKNMVKAMYSFWDVVINNEDKLMLFDLI